ncbi:hypothetical protein IQ07DRAFT_584343 [Pyrenochaeta sp. DS3sAY3a]|nr:hypothetical protein IQ07DRAFT_584343 [Pyrenochaeta sp. DS3sAY3a]
MPPKIHVVRHAQGFHNATRNYDLRDAVLTEVGKAQCRLLKSKFPYHGKIDIIFASPLRRTIQTAALSFGPALQRQEVPFVLLPILQEVSNVGCDVGIAKDEEDLKQIISGLFEKDELDFDISKVDASAVTEGWNNKEGGYWAYEKGAISKRAADLRNWLFQRSEAEIVLVTHGAFAHFLTEDWDVDDPMIGTAYKNAEHREFLFTTTSTASDAHIKETQESVTSRSPQETEDAHVLDEIKTVEKMDS